MNRTALQMTRLRIGEVSDLPKATQRVQAQAGRPQSPASAPNTCLSWLMLLWGRGSPPSPLGSNGWSSNYNNIQWINRKKKKQCNTYAQGIHMNTTNYKDSRCPQGRRRSVSVSFWTKEKEVRQFTGR